jgi:hypothetical protein
MSNNQKLEGLYGKPTPLTGACSVCGERVRLRKDRTVWIHRRTRRKPARCRGSGLPPNHGTAKRAWPSSATRKKQRLRIVSGGAAESSRRRH